MENFGKNGVLERLERLDEDADLLFEDERKFNMVIVGGSALLLLETITRATRDIDVLDVDFDVRSLLSKYDINMQVGTYINNFPYNYDKRLVLIKKGRKINFYTASLEDIIIAKLYSFRDKDLQDITDKKVLAAVDWEKLKHFAAEEARDSALNERSYNEFLFSYKNYVERWKK